MKKPSLVRIAVAVCAVIILVLVAKFTVFAIFSMEGNSMVDTLGDRELLFVNTLDRSPDRGDVVVFRAPFYEDGRTYLKRVIGVPGDTVVIREGNVFIASENGETPLNEPYLNEMNKGQTYGDGPLTGNTSEMTFIVPDGQYFVLGDNRKGSMDSRGFRDAADMPAPFVPAVDIVGTAWFY